MAEKNLIPSLFRTPQRFGSLLFPDLWEEWENQFFPQVIRGEQKTGLTISEDDKNLYAEAALPGLKAKDIDVTIDEGIVTIQGQKSEEKEDKKKKFYQKASSSFSYRFALPTKIDEKKQPKADFKDGILKLTFPKAKATKAKKISVKG